MKTIKSATILFLLVIIFGLYGFSQTHKCSHYEANQIAEKENPEALKAKAELEAFTKQYIESKESKETTYIIPVVFHVLHNYGSENISNAQILDAVRIINEDFNKLNADTTDIIPEFQAIAANSHIQFRLAKIDPNGNCTDGIVRTVTSETYNADDGTKLLSPSWNRTKYLNIWTAANIASGAAGYSFYPSAVTGAFGVNKDGVMILSTYVGSIGTGNYNLARALTHEIGHYLNLPHTWGNSNEPGLASNCDIDDGITDTPNTIGHTSCVLYSNTCGFLDNVQNYMDYSYCDKMFTNGQKARMRAALNSSTSGRNNLWTTANLIATGTNDGYVTQVCTPMANFDYDRSMACNNLTVQYSQMVWNVDTPNFTVQWSFPGGTPSVSTELNPLVSYSSPGSYSATLTATSSGGSSTPVTKSNIIQIQDPTVGENLQWTESFENSSFPAHPSNPDKNWLIRGNSVSNWSRVSSVGYSGTASLRVINASNTAGQTSELYSPNIIFTGSTPANAMTFRVAYAQKTAADDDKLQVYFSYNCGQSWYVRYTGTGASLASNGGALVSSFTPTSSQWTLKSIALSSLFLTKPNFRVKFLVTSGNGNSIFIDDINLNGTLTNTESLTLSQANNLAVYPNPINDESVLVFDIAQSSLVNISLSNILGQKLAEHNENYISGMYDLSLMEILNINLPAGRQGLQKGVYFLTVTINGKSETLKIIKQ